VAEGAVIAWAAGRLPGFTQPDCCHGPTPRQPA
jgi:hypothetical protein